MIVSTKPTAAIANVYRLLAAIGDEIQQMQTRSTASASEGAAIDRADGTTTTPERSGDTAEEFNGNDPKTQLPDRGQRTGGGGQCGDI